jgi:hypothetical protein
MGCLEREDAKMTKVAKRATILPQLTIPYQCVHLVFFALRGLRCLCIFVFHTLIQANPAHSGPGESSKKRIRSSR